MAQVSPNPVLIELTRGAHVESVHRGAIALCGPDDGSRDEGLIASLGTTTTPVFPRSAIKLMQALPLVTSGAADRFGFTAEQLALACASHSGSEAHATTANAMLGLAGLTPDNLICGAHLPLGEHEAHAMLRAGNDPARCHNNCSGKHAGMLATAAHLSEAITGYHAPSHPVQQRIRATLETLCDVVLLDNAMGVDGCSAPNWAIPLRGLATGFARLISGEGCDEKVRGAAAKLMRACWKKPEFMAGKGRLDTRLLARFPGKVFLKTGAEGVYCGAIATPAPRSPSGLDFEPARAIGFALKIDDGAKRAAETVVSALIGSLTVDGADLVEPVPLCNWDGQVVGETRLSPIMVEFCRGLRAR